MSYNKGSFASFKSSLSDGKYDTATGARRAIGKLASLTVEEKDKARKLVDAHFGEAPGSSKPKAAAGRAPAAKPVVTRQRTPAAAAPASVATKRKPGRAPAVTSAHATKVHTSKQEHDTMEDLQIGERVVASATSALQALERVGTAYETIDTKGVVQDYTTTLSRAVGLFRRVVSDRVGEPVIPRTNAPAIHGNAGAPVNAMGGGEEPYFPELTGGPHA